MGGAPVRAQFFQVCGHEVSDLDSTTSTMCNQLTCKTCETTITVHEKELQGASAQRTRGSPLPFATRYALRNRFHDHRHGTGIPDADAADGILDMLMLSFPLVIVYGGSSPCSRT